MWKYELEYRIDKPETEGETDKHFDLENYKDWLEEQLTNCRKQLSIHIEKENLNEAESQKKEILCISCGNQERTIDYTGRCDSCRRDVYERECWMCDFD